eukprot:TRINITY_DN18473_c0_g1_i1.p1 TRINITY_DN18473_c0_g1~~TRINITY_DN18473_c0_g1_i1.p1  ORF type:complete len:325 (+),score=95.99 TRINITY_DN18473_c0_g1_i1:667-1641(+)
MTEMTFGGKFGQVSAFTEEAWSRLTDDTTTMKNSASASAKIASGGSETMSSDEVKRGQTFSETADRQALITVGPPPPPSQRAADWAGSVASQPMPVRSTSARISDLLSARYFPDDAAIDAKRMVLDKAIDGYCGRLLASGEVDACEQPTPAPAVYVTALEIHAFIDGADNVVLHDTRLTWDHLSHDQPGTWSGHNDPATLTFELSDGRTVTAADYYPQRRPTYTSPYLFPSAPARFTAVQCRSGCSLADPPSQQNDWAATVNFNDNGPHGAAWYTVRVAFGTKTEAPEVPCRDNSGARCAGCLSAEGICYPDEWYSRSLCESMS